MPTVFKGRSHIVLERMPSVEYDTSNGGNMSAPDRIGVGIDLVSVARIESILDRWGERFLNRVFTRAEVDYCTGRHGSARSLAARFAAKEAFIKAVSAHSGGGIRYRDVEVVVGSDGTPKLRPHRTAQTALDGLCASLSLSHEQDVAVAIVITSPEVTG